MALIRHLPITFGLRFVRLRKLFFAFSALLVLASAALLISPGLNFGIDFRGGILIEVKTDGPADVAELRDRLGGLGLGEVTIREFGEPDDVLINLREQEGGEDAQAAAVTLVKDTLGDTVVEYRRTEFVGPTVGVELREAGMLATGLSLLAIALYIWFRFEWHFSAAALIALIHDVVALLGFYALTQTEFNLATLAAILTIAGYSINDTVVIFDRTRETLRRYKKAPLAEILDRAINQTLTRTVLTSVTTLIALIALFLFGGEVIRGFVIGLIFGVVLGTYSSVGIAVPLLTVFKPRADKAKAGETEAETEEAVSASSG